MAYVCIRFSSCKTFSLSTVPECAPVRPRNSSSTHVSQLKMCSDGTSSSPPPSPPPSPLSPSSFSCSSPSTCY